MNTMQDGETRDAAVIAQSALLHQLDERKVLFEELRSAEQLSRQIVKALQAREAQIIELIEENQTLRRRLAEAKDNDGEK